jgi:hypothetical protein
MNTAQKVICFLGALVVLYFCISVEIGQRVTVLTVKYNDNLVEYIPHSREESEHLKLKSNNNVLFFDGQYFYDEAPTHKEGSRVNLVKEDTKVINGDMDGGDFFLIVSFIGICVLFGCGMASPNTGDYYDY